MIRYFSRTDALLKYCSSPSRLATRGMLLTRIELAACAAGACFLAVMPLLLPIPEPRAQHSPIISGPLSTQQVKKAVIPINSGAQIRTGVVEFPQIDPGESIAFLRTAMMTAEGKNESALTLTREAQPGPSHVLMSPEPDVEPTTVPDVGPEPANASAAVKTAGPEPHEDKVRRQRSLHNPRDALEVQRRLAQLGYLSAVPTGFWGARSQEALRTFKKTHLLPGDLRWDRITAEALFSPKRERTRFAGVWAPEASACTPKMNRQGLLPTLISEHGARAGDASCKFNQMVRRNNTWVVFATCSQGREQWDSHLRLILDKNSLLWASERGARSYTRCDRDTVVAAR
jgi:hypothetical protein